MSLKYTMLGSYGRGQGDLRIVGLCLFEKQVFGFRVNFFCGLSEYRFLPGTVFLPYIISDFGVSLKIYQFLGISTQLYFSNFAHFFSKFLAVD